MKRLKPVLTLLSLVGLWHLPKVLDAFGINVFFRSHYDNIDHEFWHNTNTYLLAFATSLTTGAIAILISIVFGVAFGILIGYFDRYLGFFENVTKFVWSLPLIAVASYLNLLGLSTTVYSVVTGFFLGVFPVISYAYRKCIEKDEKILNMVASFNLSKNNEFKYFRIPEVLNTSNINSALAQSVPLAYIGVTMGEWLVSDPIFSKYSGLGTIFHKAMIDGRYDRVYVTMFLMMALVYSTGVLAEEFPKIKKIFKRKKPNK
jgi:ABC-type nitrate/sulfonate/bicarbonate transport system permease component